MTGWTVIVPVKGGARAKSRLPETVHGVPRATLAAAFSADTLAAVSSAAGVDRVLVVTGVSDLEPCWLGAGAPHLRVVRQAAGAGLNAAVRYAAGLATGPIAVVLGDLPALRPQDLETVLDAAASRPLSMVGDVADSGTTMLMSRQERFPMSFGPQSVGRHGRAGYVELHAPIRARADVDLVEDLDRVMRLGVGEHTAAALAGGEGDLAGRSLLSAAS
ncbi:2-phospho-L-lactate guanylyltransferase [Demequina iriomotensis]|uniref:2-phospho-L-lactate guanylyltransferase n=1 Tax=Demequina iriomotensis TaxID=1536641 RepID=UPI000784494F|nr:2-phospho-L-lactate guanylyltransferase [Demequina iriomotensis]